MKSHYFRLRSLGHSAAIACALARLAVKLQAHHSAAKSRALSLASAPTLVAHHSEDSDSDGYNVAHFYGNE